MIRRLIEKHQGNAILAAILASIVSICVGVGSVALTFYYNTQTQDRQVKLEQVSKFDGSSAELITAAGAFINAINENKDIDSARLKISQVLAAQIDSSENLKKFYGNDVRRLAKDYQSAISELNQVGQRTNTVTEMRPWTESLGRVLDTKAALSEQLYGVLGSQRRS